MNEVETGGHIAQLQDSVTQFVARGTDMKRVRRLRGNAPGHDRTVWKKLAELGWTGIMLPEEYGGSGLGLSEMAIVAQGLARALVPEPLVAGAALTGTVLAGCGNHALRNGLLEQLAGGELIPALAWQEQAGNLDIGSATVTAEAQGAGYLLSGTKTFIAGAAGADGFVVSAQTTGGLNLYWVPATTSGLKLELLPLADGCFTGRLELARATVPAANLLAEAGVAGAALAKGLDAALLLNSAELCGVMSHALQTSVDYMKTRVQFGKPIGSFQALAHRAVDLWIQQELAAAALKDGLALFDTDPQPAARTIMASRVKARCAEAGLRITREAIQIHGAIGFTDECDIGLYLRRALVLAAWLGNGAAHARRYARLNPSELD